MSSDAVAAIRLEIREKLNHRKLDSTSLGISLHILPDFPPDNIYSGSPSHYFGQIQFKLELVFCLDVSKQPNFLFLNDSMRYQMFYL